MDYIAVFARRGDKQRETAPVSFADILRCIPYSGSSVFFVQTDDYTVIEEAKACLPNNRIVSTVPPTKRGSYHSDKFLQEDSTNRYKQSIRSLETKSRQQVYEETTEMLVGLSVCILAPSCWTDTSSNVGRFLKLANPAIHTYPTEISLNMRDVRNPAFSL
jgi:hypothetical protein